VNGVAWHGRERQNCMDRFDIIQLAALFLRGVLVGGYSRHWLADCVLGLPELVACICIGGYNKKALGFAVKLPNCNRPNTRLIFLRH